MRRKIVAGNWKLHGDRAFARTLLDALVAGPRPPGVELVALPPVPYLSELIERYGSWISYRPGDDPIAWPLWLAPAALLIIGAALVRRRIRFRGQA